ncbi:MAG TPA: hypothetical protein VHD32_06530 [Candidatus Didemnitutus sp.]|nr:hypothetical protein [Candidatus Didemnitutus sp.]
MALLLVLTLVALLVVLLLGTSVIMTTSHRIGNASSHRTGARQAALLALDEALDRLQVLAGPDARITATADWSDDDANRRWTGVWEHTPGSDPISWLVSGNPAATPLAFTPTTPSGDSIELVGPGTVGPANAGAEVRAPLLTQPNAGASVHYAWWVGDEGVKASIGIPDRTIDINYAPFDRPEMRAVLRAQASREATFLSLTEAAFDPLAADNASALRNLVSFAQLNELTPFGSQALDLYSEAHQHEFTARTWGVLANTRVDNHRGLKRDLSLDSLALGQGVAAFLNYSAVMESVDAASTAIPPISGAASMRRRYHLLAPVAGDATDSITATFSIAPVLTELLVQFSIQRAGSSVQVKARMFVGLWNPFTSALVPETLQLRIAGLPTVLASDLGGAGSQGFNLQSIFGGDESPPEKVLLPFTSAGTNDTVSWLPGRWYGWTTPTGANPGPALHFYDKNMSAAGWIVTTSIPGTAHLALSCPTTTQLTFSVARADGSILATGTSPNFPAFAVPDSMATAQGGWNFGFAFRLRQVDRQSTDRGWLVTSGLDPRSSVVRAEALAAFDSTKGFDPAQYFGTPATATGLQHFLLFRSLGGSSNTSVSANNDAPVFELPRQPVVNLAELQHLSISDARPFSLGNSWAPAEADGTSVNSLFEQVFLSGLSATATHPVLAANEPLPNVHLVPFDSRPDPGAPLGLTDIMAVASDSARYLLVEGAFNCNATSARAWQAELCRLRFADEPWPRADIDNSASPSPTLGTQVATNPGTIAESFPDSGLGGPGFAVFRFPQSAEETFAATPLADPSYPDRVPFRRGVRGGDGTAAIPGFSSDAIAALANAISHRVRQHLAAFGPYRDLEEFLGGSAEFNGRSLLEDAINEVGLNPSPVAAGVTAGVSTDSGMCSLTLTQADLLGLIAPVLQARSDTFVIRAYGEIRSFSGDVTARAWCEARVQRTPAPFASNDDPRQPGGPLGRRFRVLSFRWLRPKDV